MKEINYKDMTFNPFNLIGDESRQPRYIEEAKLELVRMAMELLPEDFVVNGLRVEYRVAAKLGDCLTPTIYKIADGIIVSLSIGNEVSAIIEFT